MLWSGPCGVRVVKADLKWNGVDLHRQQDNEETGDEYNQVHPPPFLEMGADTRAEAPLGWCWGYVGFLLDEFRLCGRHFGTVVYIRDQGLEDGSGPEIYIPSRTNTQEKEKSFEARKKMGMNESDTSTGSRRVWVVVGTLY